jgi:2-amino-4-hydroxy-6-hydroxymethyldihydropteridine diphosphokinase
MLPLAVRALAALPGVQLDGVSPLYTTRPVGVEEQPDFMNAVVALIVPAGPDPETGALALLAALKQLEGALGRRERERWGPREVDLDLLLFGPHAVRAERPDGRWLEVPHAQMRQRLFVLAPLADLDSGLRPPGWDETVGHAAERQRQLEGEDAVSRVASWDADASDWLA